MSFLFIFVVLCFGVFGSGIKFYLNAMKKNRTHRCVCSRDCSLPEIWVVEVNLLQLACTPATTIVKSPSSNISPGFYLAQLVQHIGYRYHSIAQGRGLSCMCHKSIGNAPVIGWVKRAV